MSDSEEVIRKYKINVCIDYMHGFYGTILEYSVPSIGLSFNKDNIFLTEDSRYEKATLIKEVKLTGSGIDKFQKLKTCIKHQQKVISALKSVYNFEDETESNYNKGLKTFKKIKNRRKLKKQFKKGVYV